MQINLNPTSERGASRDAVNCPRETLGDSHLISSDPRSRFGLVCDLLCCRGNTSMSSLRELDLGFTGITDQSLALFRVTDSQDDHAGPHGLMKLAVLNLKETRIDGPGLANLADLANLKTIYLDSSQDSDDGLAGLEKLTTLRALNLANTQISEKALVHLEPLKQLRSRH